ncbi:zf-RING_2 domain-containing protein [Cephalotus follicularis]|uniref:Zf-RING_2 domain-containing protein n=1 Tax=Cephalotus follicularis TaxID=3775 RepID=A0A1Q3D5F4_CEPFO|nr:zf-RING_2 domain-containing protein [Cephalotus follicularis]
MRYVALYAAPTSLLSRSPPPSVSVSPTSNSPNITTQHSMLGSVILALFLPSAGMSAVFIVYICLLWYFTHTDSDSTLPVKAVAEKGLSASELDRLPKVTGKELASGTDCAVCLDEIESEQPARQVPGCNHGFHLQCVDTWLSKHSFCPLCRAKLDPHLLNAFDSTC